MRKGRMMTGKIAIIGAGPCGLSQLCAFARAREKGGALPEIVCFEKQSDWGGLWNYTWRTGTDEHGEPVHGSMYRFLWSNGPKECLEFADYTFQEHFGRAIPSFPPREVLFDYIAGRAEKSGARDMIRFGSAVRRVEWDDAAGKFRVASANVQTGAENAEVFDYVVVASGHFSTPNVPHFPGVEEFAGRVLHAHDFRNAEEFAGKRLLIIGSSYSAEDIALQCKKYGAQSVTVSHRTAPMGFKWPEGIEEVPLLSRLEGTRAHFKDGSSREIDAMILCTGYLHSFPFMEERLALQTRNRLCPPGLYKGVFLLENPKVMYLGMQDQYYTFNMFDAQAWYARDVMLGKIALPPRAEMDADAAKWLAREEKLGDPFEDIDFQTDYTRDLCEATDYPAIDLAMVSDMFKKWEHDKEESIVGYRNCSFKSPCDGAAAPVHHTPWLQAMDDSMDCFLRQPE